MKITPGGKEAGYATAHNPTNGIKALKQIYHKVLMTIAGTADKNNLQLYFVIFLLSAD